ncbi:MAG: AAA family ATPase, partial [Actinomycetia bacterium]|nr:AAA family ATPase [Actinomycetes bacterium]
MPRDEILDPQPLPDETAVMVEEVGRRPKTMADFVGQAELKERLGIILEAARARGGTVDHLLFAGPPGLGKTTLAGIVAAELNTHLHVTSGPAIERAADLASILTNVVAGDVLFIDEIHR